MTGPVVDKRDGYRARVDQAVTDFGAVRKWSAAQVAKAKRICWRTVWTECDWRLYANVKVPGSIDILPNDGYPSHGGDHLSVGLYQQQRDDWWGSLTSRMDAYGSTTEFLKGMLRDAPDWLTDNESNTCQRVQKSQFDSVTIDPSTGKPYPFGSNYAARQAQTDALEADPLYFTHRA